MSATAADAACHLVPDVLRPGLSVVFCGTALGHESYRQRAYYAHPGNLFWRTLFRTGLTPLQIAPRDYHEAVRYGIGLTDLCKTNYGNDVELVAEDFNRSKVRADIENYQPHYWAFTSKTAASIFLEKPVGAIHYGMQSEVVGATKLFVLCSPSGQARRYWREGIWQELADKVKSEG